MQVENKYRTEPCVRDVLEQRNVYVNIIIYYHTYSYIHGFYLAQNQTKDFASWKSIKIEENTDRCENYQGHYV